MTGHPDTPSEGDEHFLDLGNGEAACCGTAADMRAAAEYLEARYPDSPDTEHPDAEQ